MRRLSRGWTSVTLSWHVLLLLGCLIYGAVLALAAADSSGYPSRKEREWKDQAGRIIKRLDAQGRMFLYTYDEEGRLVRAEGLAARVDSGKADAIPVGGAAWLHCFAYNSEGTLLFEIDCVGNRHAFDPGRGPIDPRKATALTHHKHIEEAGTRPALKSPVRFEYDLHNRLK